MPIPQVPPISAIWFSEFMINVAENTDLESELTCLKCGHKKTEIMPTDACLFFYYCEGCQAMLKPLPGDCCVFCSYGSVPCPPKASGASCC